MRFEQGANADLERFLSGLQPKHPLRVILEGEHWDAEAGRLLASAPAGMNFRFLSVRGAPFGDEGIALLAAAPMLASVQTLCLERCGITDAGVAQLAASPYVRELRQLFLCNRAGVETGFPNTIGESGALALAMSPNLGRLEELDLWNTSVGDRGVETLIASPNLWRLSQLTVWATRLTEEGANRAKALVMEQWERTRDSARPRTICSIHTDYDERSISYSDDGGFG